MARMDERQRATHRLVESLERLGPVVEELSIRRPEVEGVMDDLKQEVSALKKEIDRIAANPVLGVRPADLPSLLGARPETPRTPLPLGAAGDESGRVDNGPDGHRVHDIHRGLGSGVVTTLVPSPGTGRSFG
ncbi:hypothetical protein ACP70R_047546 [Stipagrostis hirtigluma subsp. patula]